MTSSPAGQQHAKMKITFYRDVASTTPTLQDLADFGDLVDTLEKSCRPLAEGQTKDQQPLISAVAAWEVPYRANGNVRRMSACFVADIDKVTEDQMLDVLYRANGHEVFIYATYNHLQKKDPTDDPDRVHRFRLIFPLSREYAPEEHKPLWHAIDSWLGGRIDKQTKDPSRMFTIPIRTEHFFSEHLTGAPLDVDALLQTIALPREASVYTAETDAPILLDDLRQAFDEWWRGPSEHLRLVGAAGRKALAGVAFSSAGHRNDTAYKLACELIDRWPSASADSIVAPLAAGIEAAGEITAAAFADMIRRRKAEVRERLVKELGRARDARQEKIHQAFERERDWPCTEEEQRALREYYEADPKRYYVVTRDRYCYLLRPDGTYRDPCSITDLSVAAERDLAVFSDFSVWAPTKEGKPRRKTAQQLLEEYGSVMRDVQYDMAATATRYDPIKHVMTVATCPPKWEPEYHQEVQDWLLTVDPGGWLLDMSATMARLDQVAPALALTGGPATGKTFYATIAASIYGGPSIYGSAWTDMNTFTSNFNEAIRKCPIVVGDETPGREYTQNGLAFLRTHLSRRAHTFNEKYKPTGQLLGAVRMIFLANNFSQLATKEDLNTHDLEAIRERFVHLEVPEASRDYLRALGGPEYLNEVWLRQGRGPQHFLWLARHHEITHPGARFAVDGKVDKLYNKVFSRQGVKGEVITFLLNWLSDPQLAQGDQAGGVRLHEGAMYVQARAVHSLWRAVMGEDRPPSQSAISRALAGGIASEDAAYQRFGQEGGRRGYFKRIDTDVLRGGLDDHHMTEEEFDKLLRR